MPTEIERAPDGTITAILLDEDAWPVVDALLAARDERDAKAKDTAEETA